MNMQKSSLNFGDQPLKIQIVQEFHLSGQTKYLINSPNETSSLSNCCEPEQNIFLSLFYNLVALRIARLKFCPKKFSRVHRILKNASLV